MIFDGLQSDVFGTTKIVIDMQMILTKDSGGYPKWVDYGQDAPALYAYDNSTFKFIIVSEDPVALEAIVREQYQGSQIDITFENDEMLYNFTAGFTIQGRPKLKERLDHAYASYGFEITIAPVAAIDFLSLAGDRIPCDGAGYMTYSGAKIPQPREFNQQYETHKYSGVTHGSSYSSELQTIEYDKTIFNVELFAGGMRNLIDKLYLNRGNAVQCTFPAFTYPFGLARGSAEMVGELCMSSIDKITIESGDSFNYRTKIGLYDLEVPA